MEGAAESPSSAKAEPGGGGCRGLEDPGDARTQLVCWSAPFTAFPGPRGMGIASHCSSSGDTENPFLRSSGLTGDLRFGVCI